MGPRLIYTLGASTRRMDEQALIAKYIEPHPHRVGVAGARVKGRGVAVWAIVGTFLLTEGDDAVERVAHAYRVTPEAVQAALAYYRQHRDAILRPFALADGNLMIGEIEVFHA